jgi:hypothetical protein
MKEVENDGLVRGCTARSYGRLSACRRRRCRRREASKQTMRDYSMQRRRRRDHAICMGHTPTFHRNPVVCQKLAGGHEK